METVRSGSADVAEDAGTMLEAVQLASISEELDNGVVNPVGFQIFVGHVGEVGPIYPLGCPFSERFIRGVHLAQEYQHLIGSKSADITVLRYHYAICKVHNTIN